MYLSSEEKDVIETFKDRIKKEYPGEIIEVVVFGSKAKGTATEESDIDVLVVAKSTDWQIVNKLRKIGYRLDDGIDCKLSIQVMSKKHVGYLRENNFQFIEQVDSCGVLI